MRGRVGSSSEFQERVRKYKCPLSHMVVGEENVEEVDVEEMDVEEVEVG